MRKPARQSARLSHRNRGWLAITILGLLGLWWLLAIWRLGSSTAQALAPDDVATWLSRHPNAIVLDVRTPWEYQAGHIAGAHSQPLGSNESWLTDLPRERPVLLVCQHGPRSRVMAGLLARSGFHRLYELAGSMSHWHGLVVTGAQP